MRTAEAIKIINDKLGAEVTEAITSYIDDFKEDKISLLRQENRNLHLETKSDLEKQISELRTDLYRQIADLRSLFLETKSDLEKQILLVKIEFHKDLRSQTVWIISSMFAIAALIIAGIKFL